MSFPETAVERITSAHPMLACLALIGSRARDEAAEHSDWDFAYIGGSDLDISALARDLSELVGTDHLDVVDLARASGVLRYAAARDGQVLMTRDNSWERFWLEAVDFWCDAEPILREAHNEVLRELG